MVLKKTSCNCFYWLIVAILFLCGYEYSFAQKFEERLDAKISFLSIASKDDDQSFWLTANRYGIFDDNSANALSLISGKLATREDRVFDIGAGVDILARASKNSDFYFHQAYLKAKLGFIYLDAGIKETTLGHTYLDLSSGSTAMSRNARPAPRISLSIPEFYEVPYTRGWLEFKGHFSHGILDDMRYVEDPYFHDKSLYLQTGGDSGFKFYIGMVHLAIWGGESEIYGKLPSSASDFINVVIARGGGGDAPVGDQLNALGFHTGIYDWGLKTNIRNVDVHFYYQHLFTDGSGMNYKNLGDGLFGFGIHEPFSNKWITGFLYELLNTRDQSGPGLSDKRPRESYPFCEEENCGYSYGGRDNYYNNSIYLSGLSYYGLSIGSPLFLTRDQLDKVDPDIETYCERYFVSTRNLAHHIGIMGDVSESLSYKFFTTYVRYVGTYAGLNLGEPWGSLDPENNPEDYFFNPSQNQWYFLLETSWRPENINKLKITTAVAADRGDLFNNYGFMLGVSWNIVNQRKL